MSHDITLERRLPRAAMSWSTSAAKLLMLSAAKQGWAQGLLPGPGAAALQRNVLLVPLPRPAHFSRPIWSGGGVFFLPSLLDPPGSPPEHQQVFS